VRAEAGVRPERVADHGQRLAQVLLQHCLVGQVGGGLAQAVHVVAEGDQARGDGVVDQGAEGVAHHGRAGHLAEGAQVRQARGAVAGLQDHRFGQGRKGLHGLVGLAAVDQRGGEVAFGVGQTQPQNTGEQGARLLERPGASVAGEGGKAFKHGAGYRRCRRRWLGSG